MVDSPTEAGGGRSPRGGTSCAQKLVAAGPFAGVGRASEAHDRGAQIGMAEERGHVGAEGQRLQIGGVISGGVPALLALESARA